MELNEQIPFLTHFSEVPDPRIDRHKRHKLSDLLFISVCAVFSGAQSCVAIADFAKKRRTWLERFVSLEGGTPSHDTVSRVLSLLDPLEFERSFALWTASIQKKTAGTIIAIDGKTVRRSFDKATGQAAIHMVSAWGSANGVTLAQVKTDDKSNEITAIPKLLEMLDLEGRIVTMDAMGTQKTIAKQIAEKGGDYLLSVKGNHHDLYGDIQGFFDRYLPNHFMNANADIIPHSYTETLDADHGRIETRRCWCSSVLEDIDNVSAWSNLKTIALIESERLVGGKTTVERRYYISSLRPDARRILRAARTHWGVENSLHWVLDVTFREDESRTRKGSGAQIKSAINKIAINLCKMNTTQKASIARKRNFAAWDESFLEELITGRPALPV